MISYYMIYDYIIVLPDCEVWGVRCEVPGTEESPALSVKGSRLVRRKVSLHLPHEPNINSLATIVYLS